MDDMTIKPSYEEINISSLPKTEREILLINSLVEIADHLGDDLQNPLSLSLLCLTFGVSGEQQSRILAEFNEIANKTSLQDMNLTLFIDVIIKHCKHASDFSELVFIAFIKASAKFYVPNLYPFAMSLII